MGNNDANIMAHQYDLNAGVKRVFWPVIRHHNELLQTAEIQLRGGRVYELQGKKIGEILNLLGAIDQQTLCAVEQHHKTKKVKSKPIGELLVHMGIIEKKALSRALCIQSGVLMVDLQRINIPRDLHSLIPFEQAKIKKVIPVATLNKSLYLAVADPANLSDKHLLEHITQLNIKHVYAPLDEIQTYLDTKWADLIVNNWAS